MIEIKPFKDIKYEVYDSTGLLGIVNQEQISDIAIQCALNKIEDVYLMFGETKIKFNSKGEMSEYPKGFLDQIQRQFAVLFKIRKFNSGTLSQFDLDKSLRDYEDYYTEFLM